VRPAIGTRRASLSSMSTTLTLKRIAVQQSNEDAREILQILAAAFADCRMSLDLRQRLAAVKERAERVVRNTETTP
jgi:hypothetical protein